MTHRVSAIISTHNRATLVRRAIDSVKNQSFPNIEIIVVDDSSTDGTHELLEADPSIKYVYIPPEKSRGANHARNEGIAISSGEYIAFLDDDDCWFPDKIEKQINLIEEKDCDLVYCGRREELVDDDVVSYYDVLPDPLNQGDMSRRGLYTACCLTSMILISRRLLNKTGLWDESLDFWQDHEFLIRAAQHTPFYYVNEPLCLYRKDLKDSQRLTNQYHNWRKSVEYVHEKHRKLYSSLSLKERVNAMCLVWDNALIRSHAAGMKWTHLYYRFIKRLFFSIPRNLCLYFDKTLL